MEKSKIVAKQRKAALLAEPVVLVICKHCGEEIDEVLLIGLSLLCPMCGKPQNGNQMDPVKAKNEKKKVLCKDCGMALYWSELRGISLICPHCGIPQDSQH